MSRADFFLFFDCLKWRKLSSFLASASDRPEEKKKNHTILPMFYKRYNKILYLLLINAITCHFVWHQRSPSCWPKGNMKRNNRNNALVLVAKSLLAGKLKTSLSCAFLTRGTLWVLQGFNPLQCVTNAVLDDRGPPNCLQIIKRLFISL